MQPTFNKKSFRDANRLLNELCLTLDGKKASSNKSTSKKPNPDGKQESWWLRKKGKCSPFVSPRCKAYLRAYVEIAGPNFFGSGIPLDEGFIYPDRGVMKALLQADCVTLSKRGIFELTPKGHNLIAGIDLPGHSKTVITRRELQSRFERLPSATKAMLGKFVAEKELTSVQREVAHSIIVANQADPSKWGLRLSQKDIMLKVGFVEVLQAGDGWFHQLVKKNLIPKKLASDRRISFNNHSYKNAPGCITCDFDVSSVAELYQALLPAHEAGIRIAALSPRHTTTKNDHAPSFIEFLSEQLNERLPQPAYYDSHLTAAVPISPPPGSRDSGRVQIFSTLYPKVAAESPEGKKVWKEQQMLERDKSLSRAAKAANRDANGGRFVCEACSLSSESAGLFDAHHLNPLACGIRQSRVDDFAILCPTCHRWAHVFGPDKLQPLSMVELRDVRGGRQPVDPDGE